ncbi:MAG: methyltransferase domain-containing protein [Candidatus Cloacimonadales bacterium]|nr:methyltransferase domain-containing protein [Candidatus Cloacimonadales bacterium]
MNFKKYAEANRRGWNQVMPFHKKAMDEKWDAMFVDQKFIFQKDQELEELNKIGVTGKRIAHLSCNNGIELMSLKRMGAGHCVGFDISDIAIEEAKKRAAKFKIDCEFVRTDVLEITQEYFGNFDLVYITVGALVWIPDRRKYFEKAANLLVQGGQLFIYEHHPFGNVIPYDEEFAGELKIVHNYFDTRMLEETGGIDYYGGESYKSSPSFEFPYTLSELLNLIAESGFCLRKFNEYPEDIAMCRDYMNKQKIKLPLSYILVSEKLWY